MSYRDLKTYQTSKIIYDFTVAFCRKYIISDRSYRIYDQTVQAQTVRRLVYKTNWSYQTYIPYLSSPQMAANAAICLINQANFLLDRQIKALEEKFISQGGWTENLYRQRLAYRTDKSNRSKRID